MAPTLTVLVASEVEDAERKKAVEGCGACTVVVGEMRDGRLRLRPVNACILFVPALHGRALLTVEDLAARSGELAPVQRALVRHHGSQCGFCTPGIVMALHAHARSEPTPSHATAIRALAGNLCRCPAIVRSSTRRSRKSRRRAARRFDRELVRLLARSRRTTAWSARGTQRWEAPVTLDAPRNMPRHPTLLVAGATDVRLVTKDHRQIIPCCTPPAWRAAIVDG
jgi:xanthine dehydrogenase small subunit